MGREILDLEILPQPITPMVEVKGEGLQMGQVSYLREGLML